MCPEGEPDLTEAEDFFEDVRATFDMDRDQYREYGFPPDLKDARLKTWFDELSNGARSILTYDPMSREVLIISSQGSALVPLSAFSAEQVLLKHLRENLLGGRRLFVQRKEFGGKVVKGIVTVSPESKPQ